jgi:hypothetical protein
MNVQRHKQFEKLIVRLFSSEANRILSQRAASAEEAHKLKKFVPKSPPLSDADLKIMSDFVINSKNLFVLSGAGISTESGKREQQQKKIA